MTRYLLVFDDPHNAPTPDAMADLAMMFAEALPHAENLTLYRTDILQDAEGLHELYREAHEVLPPGLLNPEASS